MGLRLLPNNNQLPVRDSIPHGVIKCEGALADLVEQRRLALVIEGRVAAQQDEEHNACAPKVDCRRVNQPGCALQGWNFYDLGFRVSKRHAH